MEAMNPITAYEARAPAASSAKWWGAASGVTRAEVLYGVPHAGVELALANGKRHVPAPTHEVRTRAEVLQGLPLTGRGADLSVQGGRQKFIAPPPPVRTKIEALNGLPMSGRDADIALAGGRQHFPSKAGVRSGSAPPPPCNETVRDLQILDSHQACGRGVPKKERAAPAQVVSPRGACTPQAPWNPYSPRARSSESGGCSPCSGGACSPRRGTGSATPSSSGVVSPSVGGAASPRLGGASSPRTGGSPRALASRRVPGALKGQQSRRKLSGVQQPPIFEEGIAPDACMDRFGACADVQLDYTLEKGISGSCLDSTYPDSSPTDPRQDPCASMASLGSMASSASLASLTSELSQCLNLSTSVKSMARTASTSSIVSPENRGGALNSAVEDVLRCKMETAWQAICVKLNIPYEAGPPTSPSGTASCPLARVARMKVQAHPFRPARASTGQLSAR